MATTSAKLENSRYYWIRVNTKDLISNTLIVRELTKALPVVQTLFNLIEIKFGWNWNWTE